MNAVKEKEWVPDSTALRWPAKLIQLELDVEVFFFEQLLGTSAEKEVHREFIASKAPDAASMEEEVQSLGVDVVAQKGLTKFARDGDQPIIWDYHVKGFCKDVAGMLARVPKTRSSKVRAFRKIVDGLVFVRPRKIVLTQPSPMEHCERPLRASGPQGERVALAASEALPSGSRCQFTIGLLDKKLEPVVMEWLDYGQLRGFGQWRNSGKGRFMYRITRRELGVGLADSEADGSDEAQEDTET